MSNKKLYTKQNGKNVSLCFINNETFKQLVENKTETEQLELGNNIYLSALKVLEDSNKRYGTLSRQLKMVDKDSILYTITNKKLEATNETIENINEALEALENGSDKFYWLKYMIEACIGRVDAIQDEED